MSNYIPSFFNCCSPLGMLNPCMCSRGPLAFAGDADFHSTKLYIDSDATLPRHLRFYVDTVRFYVDSVRHTVDPLIRLIHTHTLNQSKETSIEHHDVRK